MFIFKLLVLAIAIWIGAYICYDADKMKSFALWAKIPVVVIVLLLASNMLKDMNWITTIVASIIYLATLIIAFLIQRLTIVESQRDYLRALIRKTGDLFIKEE